MSQKGVREKNRIAMTVAYTVGVGISAAVWMFGAPEQLWERGTAGQFAVLLVSAALAFLCLLCLHFTVTVSERPRIAPFLNHHYLDNLFCSGVGCLWALMVVEAAVLLVLFSPTKGTLGLTGAYVETAAITIQCVLFFIVLRHWAFIAVRLADNTPPPLTAVDVLRKE